MKFVIDFEPVGRRIVCDEPTNIFEAAHLAGIELRSVCGGVGNCGKCRVKVIGDEVSPLAEQELEKLTPDEITLGFRQACRTYVSGPIKVYIPASSLNESQKLQLSGSGTNVSPDPFVSKVFIRLTPPTLEDTQSDLARLVVGLSNPTIKAGLPVLQKLSPTLRTGEWAVTITLDEDEIIDVEPGDTTGQLLGLGVDLGTTKIAVYLVDLLTGETIASQGRMNPQIAYGEDVISRIRAAANNQANADHLQSDVIQTLNEISTELLAARGLSSESIAAISLVGNTAMHHLFLGLPVRSLAISPFTATIANPIVLKAEELGLMAAPGASVYLLPPIAGFVGSDHTAAILASLSEREDRTNFLLLDIGTNTEIALCFGSRIFSCSCASGPAFEGAHIKYGMRAAPGAIERVHIEQQNSEVHISTIDDEPPVGICGSGILDAVAEMVRIGIVDARGHFCKTAPGVRHEENGKSPSFVLSGREDGGRNQEVEVTQEDLIELQLAKGAIRAGVDVLFEKAGIGPQGLDEVIIAGAFGNYLDPLNAIRIGLLPDVPLERIKQVGNAAGVGARLALVNRGLWEKGIAIARKVEYIELTSHPSFRKLFARAVRFSSSTLSIFH